MEEKYVVYRGKYFAKEVLRRPFHFLNGLFIYDISPYFYISNKIVKFKVNRLSDFRVIADIDLKNVISRKTHIKF